MMPRRLRNVAITSLFGVGVLAIAFQTAGASDEYVPTIKEVMQVLNKGGKAESAKLKKALGSQSPDWAAIKMSSKQFSSLGPELGRSEPPKGELASWKKLTDAYAADCKALDAAAEKEDLAGTKAAFQKLSTSCMTCHKAHKG